MFKIFHTDFITLLQKNYLSRQERNSSTTCRILLKVSNMFAFVFLIVPARQIILRTGGIKKILNYQKNLLNFAHN